AELSHRLSNCSSERRPGRPDRARTTVRRQDARRRSEIAVVRPTGNPAVPASGGLRPLGGRAAGRRLARLARLTAPPTLCHVGVAREARKGLLGPLGPGRPAGMSACDVTAPAPGDESP